jgi:hypothetical protein
MTAVRQARPVKLANPVNYVHVIETVGEVGEVEDVIANKIRTGHHLE